MLTTHHGLFIFSLNTHSQKKKKKINTKESYVASDIYIVINKTRMWECGHAHASEARHHIPQDIHVSCCYKCIKKN